MRGLVQSRLNRSVEGQKGFALIEMLVVIGIIVALAAVIVPLVVQFSGSGAQAAADAEWDAVQTSVDTMMADNEMTLVIAAAVTTLITDGIDWDPDALVTTTLVNYTRDPQTAYCYQWEDSGRLTLQFEYDASLALPACTAVQVNPQP